MTRQRRRAGTKLRMKDKGAGVDAFLKANKLTPSLADKIIAGEDSIAGHRPDQVRNMRNSLRKFGWGELTR